MARNPLRKTTPTVPMAAAAGSWRATSGRPNPLRRTPSPPQQAYTQLVTVDLGNDGVAPTVTFPASGTVTAQVGPSGVGTTWSLDQCQASTSIGPLDTSQVALYIGPAALPQYQVAANLAGGGSQFGLGGTGVMPGWFLIAVWTGGTPGATANLNASGSKTALNIPAA